MHGGGHGKKPGPDHEQSPEHQHRHTPEQDHDHEHDHHHGAGHCFPFAKAPKLDSPERSSQQPAQPLLDMLAPSPEHTLLDLGAGTGYFTLPLARFLAAHDGTGCIYALDIEPRMLDLIRKKASAEGLGPWIKTMGLSPSQPEDLPLADQSIQRALLVNLFHELARPGNTLRSVHRVLSSGGTLLIVDWDPDGRQDIGPRSDHRVPAEQVAATLADAGFTSISRVSLYTDYYSLCATK